MRVSTLSSGGQSHTHWAVIFVSIHRIAAFGLPEGMTAEIYKEAVLKTIQKAFDDAVTDRRLTPDEDNRLVKMAAHLGVNSITHSDEDRVTLERFRLLARIEAGELPVLTTGIRLQRGEVCHAEFRCRLHEKRTVTKRVNYAGPTGSIRIMKGLSFRYGSVSVSRVTSEELRQIDAGTLYVTNKRLLFNAAARNLNVPYKKVIAFTMYADGVQVEKDTGRDQYFLGSRDLELLGAVLDAAIGKATWVHVETRNWPWRSARVSTCWRGYSRRSSGTRCTSTCCG